MIKKTFKFSLILGAIWLIHWGTHKATDGFAIEKICSNLSYHAEWAVPEPSEEQFREVGCILNQKFTYLGKGAQCFVFLSEDQQSVLKFFRHSHMRPALWLTLFPFPGSLEVYRQTKIATRFAKLYKDFGSYKIAFEEMKEHTGIQYLHLNKTTFFHKKVTIVDKLGIAHQLDLDQMEFMLQSRATLVYPTLESLIAQGNIPEAKQALTSLMQLLICRAQKGIFDKDPDLSTNFGFTKQGAIQIDIGRFKKDPTRTDPAVYRDELIRITDKLQRWLDSRSPELKTHLQKEIDALSV
jgi:hypothetical protein